MASFEVNHSAAGSIALRELDAASRGVRNAIECHRLGETDPFREIDVVGHVLQAAKCLLELEANGLSPDAPEGYLRELIELHEAISEFVHFAGRGL